MRSMQEVTPGALGLDGQGQGRQPEGWGDLCRSPAAQDLGNSSLSCVPAFWAPLVPGHTTLLGPGVWPGGSVFSGSAASPPGTGVHTHTCAYTSPDSHTPLPKRPSSLRATAL